MGVLKAQALISSTCSQRLKLRNVPPPSQNKSIEEHVTMSKSRGNQAPTPIWLIISSVVATVGAGLWWLFRRPCKHLTNEDLPPTVSDDIEVVRELNEEERFAIKTSFLSGDDFRWMVSGKDYKVHLDENQHREATFSCVDYFLACCERYGDILVCRDKDGTFLGAVGLIPPYENQTLYTLHFYRTVIPMGLPAPVKADKNIAARFQAFSRVATEHEELMKGIPHWYVQVIGVSDNAQGKGVGTRLMEAATAMAGGMPMYLDCHNGNVSFYERLGFVVGRNYEIVPKEIEDTSTFEMNGMVRGLRD